MADIFYDSDLELIPSRTNHYGNTDYGHSLANKIMEGKELEGIVEVHERKDILKYTPKFISAAPNKRTLIKGELGRLKKAGFEIKKYSNMETSEMWNYYIFILKENNLLKS